MTMHPALPTRSAATLFRSLADPARLTIVQCLAHGEHRVRDLMGEVGLAQSTVSEHVACLRGCGLVRGRPEGRQVFYSLACPELVDLLASAERVLDRTSGVEEDCPRLARDGKSR